MLCCCCSTAVQNNESTHLIKVQLKTVFFFISILGFKILPACGMVKGMFLPAYDMVSTPWANNFLCFYFISVVSVNSHKFLLIPKEGSHLDYSQGQQHLQLFINYEFIELPSYRGWQQQYCLLMTVLTEIPKKGLNNLLHAQSTATSVNEILDFLIHLWLYS